MMATTDLEFHTMAYQLTLDHRMHARWHRLQWLRIAIVVGLSWLLLFGSGCTPSKESAPTVPSENSLPKHPEASKESEPKETVRPTTPEKPTVDSGKEPGMTESDVSTVSNSPPGKLQRKSWTTQRFIYLAETVPLVIDFEVDVNGVSLEEARGVTETVLRTRLEIQDGCSWTDLLAKPLIATRRFGNLAPSSDAQKKSVISQYDSNRDEKVQGDELLNFFTRGLARKEGVVLSQSDEYRELDLRNSKLFLTVDSDRDDQWSLSEIEALPAKLSQLDSNGDGKLTPEEYWSSDAQSREYVSTSRRADGEDYLISVAGSSSKTATNEIFKFYAVGNAIGFEDAMTDVGIWKRLDQDNDHQVSKKELDSIWSIEPDFKLQASFGIATDDQSSKKVDHPLESKVVWLRSGDDGNWVPVAEKEATSDSIISFGNVRIATILIDPFDKTNLDQFIALRAKRMGLDEKSPRDLSGEDSAKPSDEFDLLGLDANADKKLQWDEYRSAWHDRANTCNPLVRFHSAFHSDRIVAFIDRNLDQVLSAKEVQDAAKQLSDLKRSAQTEQDTSQLFPQSLLIVATRFLVSENQPLANSLELIEERTRSEPMELPEWFRAMDANSDGEISSVEFIGPLEKFQSADKNQNGVIEGAEIITKQ